MSAVFQEINVKKSFTDLNVIHSQSLNYAVTTNDQGFSYSIRLQKFLLGNSMTKKKKKEWKARWTDEELYNKKKKSIFCFIFISEKFYFCYTVTLNEKRQMPKRWFDDEQKLVLHAILKFYFFINCVSMQESSIYMKMKESPTKPAWSLRLCNYTSNKVRLFIELIACALFY